MAFETEGRRAPRVLLVEADPECRRLVRDSLGVRGCRVVEADDEAAALACARSRAPDLALVAVGSAGFDGLALCRSLRAQPETSAIPILVLLPLEAEEAVETACAIGASDVIRKPLSRRLLTHRVGLLLEAVASRDALRRTRERLESLQRLARVATWEWSVADERLRVSEGVRVLFGLGAEEGPVTPELLLARACPDDHPAVRAAVVACLRDGKPANLDVRVSPAGGSERFLHAEAEPILDPTGRPIRLVGTLQDVTERKHAEQQMRFLADHDSLTGLANRRSFVERLSDALAQARRYERAAALLFLDLDHFKRINDTLGHSIGDRLLQGVALRLMQCTRQSDTVARRESPRGSVSRLGGDEFTVLLSEIGCTDDAARVAARIIESLRDPFVVEGHELVIGASIGITVYPLDGQDVDTLLRNADTAMYQAKEKGRNTYQFFAESMNAAASKRMLLEHKLRRALEAGKLELHYQPQIEMATGRIAGVEALMRWHDPDLGPVSPTEFIALAEESGLILDICDWSLRTACRQCAAWRREGLPPVRMAVNVSPRNFRGGMLARTLIETLWDTGIDPRLLEIEITESTLMQDQDAVVGVLEQLKRIGASVSLDDFGTGYSSLSYLKRFPVDVVKIDRSFVRDVVVDPDDAALTSAIISIARALRLRVVAEGVETEAQRQFLRERGCDEMQGFLFSPPVTADAIAGLLRAQRPA